MFAHHDRNITTPYFCVIATLRMIVLNRIWTGLHTRCSWSNTCFLLEDVMNTFFTWTRRISCAYIVTTEKEKEPIKNKNAIHIFNSTSTSVWDFGKLNTGEEFYRKHFRRKIWEKSWSHKVASSTMRVGLHSPNLLWIS